MANDDSRSSLSEAVFDHVVERIVSGDYYPAMYLNEREIADSLEVSRVPVREALKRLENDGWVTRNDKGRVHVRRITEEDLKELAELREGLEGVAARRAALRINDQELAELKKELEILVKHDQKVDPLLDEKNAKAHQDADRRFHSLIVEVANNSRISRIYESVILQSQSFFFLRGASMRLGVDELIFPNLVPHQDVYDAIAAHNPDEAESLMRRHIRSGAESLLRVKSLLGIS